MATQPIAIASDVNEVESLDEYGRTEAERSVTLESKDAELIDREVAAGGHQTYDGALHYVMSRGFAEIERQRKAQAEARSKTVLKATRDLYTNMLALNPALVADQNFVAKMLADLGVNKNSQSK